MSEKGVCYEAWSRSMIGFIRERGLEVEFADWCGGWKCQIADERRASPTPEGRGERDAAESQMRGALDTLGQALGHGAQRDPRIVSAWSGVLAAWAALLSSPRVEREAWETGMRYGHAAAALQAKDVKREAMEEAAALFENAAHTQWTGSEIADVIRALSPPVVRHTK